jgi:methylated-DNA-[protein]-cysteine S-methyltransferase
MILCRRVIQSPIGRLTLVGSEDGLREIRWPLRLPAGDSAALEHAAVWPSELLAETQAQLDEYFAGRRRRFTLPLDLVGTPFQVDAWRALADIPFATTVSYGEQARRLGRPGAARAVGAANGRNPVPIVLPCHRVVGVDGSLTGFGGGLWRKQALLAHEAAVQGVSAHT